VDYHLAAVPLGEMMEDLRAMIEPQLQAKGLTYEVRVGADTVRADREKLQQVLLNLLSNAAKFTDRGGRVTVEAGRSDAAPDVVLMHVTDTGIGIAPDKLERVFEPFVQVDSSHSRLGQGTGLGLAISRDLARGMGGDLHVRSVLGQGSTFTLSLPEALRE
jgi:signal transduction histidine kinase